MLKPSITGIQPPNSLRAMSKALLFINGEPPEELPEITGYTLIGCTDGAFHYLKAKGFPLSKLNFISGDFDSHSREQLASEAAQLFNIEIIHTPDQDRTDFAKALEILSQKGITDADVYGGSGSEMDHFLGNLTVAHQFDGKVNVRFFDRYSTYFFIPYRFILRGANRKLVSLYPFPVAENITAEGLNWPLNGETLAVTGRIGTRNFAVSDEVRISYESGSLLIFVGKEEY